MQINNKVALVTGAAHRIGRAIALQLAQQGAHIALHYHTSQTEADQTLTELETLGAQVFPIQANLVDDNALESMIQAIIKHFGKIDILVNNAALFERTPFPESPLTAWDKVMAVNLRAPYACAKAVAPFMLKAQQGSIINISDMTAFAPIRGRLAHSVAKAGLISLTQALALELRPFVRVNLIAPGSVLPDPTYSETLKNRIADRTLLKRWGNAMDVAKTVQFIIENDYLNAEVIRVDGGELIAWRDL